MPPNQASLMMSLCAASLVGANPNPAHGQGARTPNNSLQAPASVQRLIGDIRGVFTGPAGDIVVADVKKFERAAFYGYTPIIQTPFDPEAPEGVIFFFRPSGPESNTLYSMFGERRSSNNGQTTNFAGFEEYPRASQPPKIGYFMDLSTATSGTIKITCAVGNEAHVFTRDKVDVTRQAIFAGFLGFSKELAGYTAYIAQMLVPGDAEPIPRQEAITKELLDKAAREPLRGPCYHPKAEVAGATKN